MNRGRIPSAWPALIMVGTAISCTDPMSPAAADSALSSQRSLVGTIGGLVNLPPVAIAGGPYFGTAGSSITLDGTASVDLDGSALTYAWSFGDGATGTEPRPTHVYAAAGTYIVTLTVTDAQGQSSVPVLTAAHVAAASTTILMKDSFSRTVADGWGNADIGGAWLAEPGPSFGVDGSRGTIDVADTQARKVVGGLETYGLDVAGLVSISVDRAPDVTDRFHTVQVFARRNDRESEGNNHYRYRLRIFGRGTMDVRIEKQVNGVSTWLLPDDVPLDITFTPGAKYWIRWEAVGTSPSTTVRMRVWQDGTSEPTTWHASATNDEPGLDVSGTTGVRFWAPQAEQVAWPIRVFVDDLQYSLKN